MSQHSHFTQDQLACIRRALAPFEPAVIYLFGSFGGPAQHPQSDIDLAFLPTIFVAPLACFYLAGQLAEQLAHPVDLVDLKQDSTVLAKEVLRTGSPLFIFDSAIHQQFEMLTLADYARLNEERQAVLIQ